MNYVLDASAMIAYLRQEVGWHPVFTLLTDANHTCFAHSANLCEVFYDFTRIQGEPAAEAAILDLQALGVVERADMDAAFWRDIGRIKAAHRVSFADCFGISLARRVGAELVTSDHHEFDPLVPLGLVPFLFIR